MNFADRIIEFNRLLSLNIEIKNIEVLNPFANSETRIASEAFYRKFYNDDEQRVVIFGINPGRLGGGLTGVPFTDPVRLENDCGIINDFRKKPELSSTFIYEMIRSFGGTKKFYSNYFITSVSPLGFLYQNKNLNYYDDKQLFQATEPFIHQSLKTLMDFNIEKRFGFCLGEGLNFKHLSSINNRLKLFDSFIPLPHPRWIMQYRRKSLNEYIGLYLQKFNEAYNL